MMEKENTRRLVPARPMLRNNIHTGGRLHTLWFFIIDVVALFVFVDRAFCTNHQHDLKFADIVRLGKLCSQRHRPVNCTAC